MIAIRHLIPVLLLLFFSAHLSAQAFPDVSVRTLDRKYVQLADYVGQGKTTVIAVWSTTCGNCIIELDHMKAYKNKWADEYQTEIIAVSMDQFQQIRMVKPMVTGRKWPYKVFIDQQRELGQLLNFKTIPQLFVVNGEGQIIKQFSKYMPGREVEIDRMLASLK
jgi:thiol-disulfide isomerase/thioredoxin